MRKVPAPARMSSAHNWAQLTRVALVASAVVAIILASWLPGDAMVRSGHLSGRAEHIAAYIVLGIICLELGPPTFARADLVVLLVLFAVIMEFGQNVVPGRSATFADALASIAGVVVAFATHLSWQAYRRRVG